MKFNEYVKSKRVNNRISLREFCRRINQDPSNWSKIERGVLPPPKTSGQLAKIAEALEFQINSDDYKTLFELAAIDFIPVDLVDKDVLKKLPVFFRTIRGDTPTEEELYNLIKVLRS